MQPTDTVTAKQQVLDWVRSKNPQTMELKFGCWILRHDFGIMREKVVHVWGEEGEIGGFETVRVLGNDVPSDKTEYVMDDLKVKFEILGSDMGLQELLIALRSNTDCTFGINDVGWFIRGAKVGEERGWKLVEGMTHVQFDLTKNLHKQSEEFYESILPIIPHD